MAVEIKLLMAALRMAIREPGSVGQRSLAMLLEAPLANQKRSR